MEMNLEQLKDSILNLQQALEQKLPGMKSMLSQIYNHMKNDPSVVTALKEDEIAAVIMGLKHHANIEIPVSKQSSPKSKKTPITVADL